ncbi:hypothetical protein ACNKHR_00655 [Shigella flexneri]
MQLKTEHLPTKAANANLGFQKLPDLAVQAQQKAPLDALRSFLETFDGPVVFSEKVKVAVKRWVNCSHELKLLRNALCVLMKPATVGVI